MCGVDAYIVKGRGPLAQLIPMKGGYVAKGFKKLRLDVHTYGCSRKRPLSTAQQSNNVFVNVGAAETDQQQRRGGHAAYVSCAWPQPETPLFAFSARRDEAFWGASLKRASESSHDERWAGLQVDDWFIMAGYDVVGNSAEKDCFWVATAPCHKLSPQRAKDVVGLHGVTVQGLPHKVCSEIAHPGSPTSNEHIRAAVSALDFAFPSGVLVLHSPAQCALWFRPHGQPRVVGMGVAKAMTEVSRRLVVLQYIEPSETEGEEVIGHFELCVKHSCEASPSGEYGPSVGCAPSSARLATRGGMMPREFQQLGEQSFEAPSLPHMCLSQANLIDVGRAWPPAAIVWGAPEATIYYFGGFGAYLAWLLSLGTLSAAELRLQVSTEAQSLSGTPDAPPPWEQWRHACVFAAIVAAEQNVTINAGVAPDISSPPVAAEVLQGWCAATVADSVPVAFSNSMFFAALAA